jgi:hypothetical protein
MFFPDEPKDCFEFVCFCIIERLKRNNWTIDYENDSTPQN